MDQISYDEVYKKEVKLISLLKSYERVLVAFSGGVDSTYLLAVAQESLGQNCKAIYARGPMISSEEEMNALALARHYDFPVHVINFDALELNEFRENPPDRCYFCKKNLFEEFLKVNEQLSNSFIIEGTNASDTQDYRPGRRALEELGIKSPLLEVGLSKTEIRVLSRRRSLLTWDKPSMACLASRVPYGDQITAELLQRISRAEAVLMEKGYPECRVRAHGNIARIEIPTDNFNKFIQEHSEIVPHILLLGFQFVTLDLLGLRSGSLNPTLQEEQHERRDH